MLFFRHILSIIIKSGIIGYLLVSNFSYAGLNKWVDEKGQTHYGDRVPSKYLTKEHSILNDQGVTVRTNEALKTDEELSEEEKQRALKAKEDRQRIMKERTKALRDRVLLDTFTTEKDLILARDARIEAVNSQISLAETLIKHDEKKLEDVQLRIKSLEAAGRKPPENLHKEVISVGRQLENNYAYIEDQNNARAEILKTFDQDIKRFRELMKEKYAAEKK